MSNNTVSCAHCDAEVELSEAVVHDATAFCCEACRDEYNRGLQAEESGLVQEATVSTGRVDWQQLRMQKNTLINLAGSKHMTDEQVEHIEGLLNFLDTIQDAAAEQLGEDVVFCPYPGQEE